MGPQLRQNLRHNFCFDRNENECEVEGKIPSAYLENAATAIFSSHANRISMPYSSYFPLPFPLL